MEQRSKDTRMLQDALTRILANTRDNASRSQGGRQTWNGVLHESFRELEMVYGETGFIAKMVKDIGGGFIPEPLQKE